MVLDELVRWLCLRSTDASKLIGIGIDCALKQVFSFLFIFFVIKKPNTILCRCCVGIGLRQFISQINPVTTTRALHTYALGFFMVGAAVKWTETLFMTTLPLVFKKMFK